jgi:pyridoxal phosphate enzyme (YggS family)
MPAPIVAEAVLAGVDVLGENRVQEAEAKIPAVHHTLPPDVLVSGRSPRWHLIGHLQTNKAKAAVDLFDVIESVDSVRLAQALDQRSRAAGRRREVLLQVNVVGEESKGGFAPDELRRAAGGLAGLEGLTFGGLMTIAPLTEDRELLRGVFRGMRLLFDEVAGAFSAESWRHLSMGMSGDFEQAIAEGATIVRIGRAIFGERG